MNNYIVSLIRTYVPIGVGAVLSWLLTKNVQIDSETQTGLVIGITGMLQGLYYALVRILEVKFPFLGFLIGSSKKPKYEE